MADTPNNAPDADLSARATDPRSDPRSSSFDRGFAQETDRLYQQRYGGASQPTNSMADDGLKARNLDPRNDPSKREYEPAFAAETDKLYQQRYGGSRPAAPTADTQNAPSSSVQFMDQVPGDIQGYRLSESEVLAPFMAQLEHDELFKDARAWALDAQITDRQFDKFVRPFLERMADMNAGGDDLNARIQDPRNDPHSPQFKRVYALETDRLLKARHG